MKPIHVIFYTLLTIIAVTFLGVMLIIFVIISFSDTTPTVENNSTLVIQLSGQIPEFLPKSGLPIKLGPSTSLKAICDNIEKARVDQRIKGILLRINRNTLGWAKLDELKELLANFKNSGKYVIAYLGSYVSESDYYLALSADSIFVAPGGFMEMNGLVIETIHLPGLLEKLGITVDYFAYGKYKSRSGEELGRKKHSAPVLEMLNDLLDWQYAHLVNAIAKRWNISESQVKSVFDQGYFSPEKFRQLGWVDGILYEDQLFDRLKALNGTATKDKLNQISSTTYERISSESLGLNKGRDQIALIYSQGIIQEGDDQIDPLSFEFSAGTDPIIRALRKATKSRSVKAIVFRVDSPGGSGLGCDLVWREILKAKEKKPVIVSMSDYAASGGYWVSMGASAIVAQPSTLTGSIGIWSVFPNVSGLYDKLGLVPETIKRGEHADMFLGVKKLSDYEKKLLSDRLLDTYRDFVAKAASSRGKSYDELEPYAQGRSWMGEQALKLGLIDDLGGLDRAIQLAKQKAGIDTTTPVKVVVFTTMKGWIERLISSPMINWIFKSMWIENIHEQWEEFLYHQQALIWPMMPYRIKIH